MRSVIFEHRHPVEGSVRVTQSGDLVEVDCHWPFDISTDEWIDIDLEMDVSTYAAAIRDATPGATVKIPGVKAGFFQLDVQANHKILMSISSGVGSSTVQLRAMPIDARVEQFRVPSS